MTIATTQNKAQWQGNGSTTVFPFSFEIGNVSEITLTLLSAGTTTTIPSSSYSVSGLGSPNGGTITYPLSGAPIATGATLTLVRTVPLQQLTDLQNQSNYFPDAVEGALDYAMMAIQQIAGQVASAVQFPQSDSPSLNPILPAAAARAGQILAFDSNGNVTTLPMPSSVGAGTMTPEGPFVSGVDFTPGATTTLTLSKQYGTPANVDVHFDSEYQGTDQYTISGYQIIFSSPIPAGFSKVYIVGGTTLSVNVPPAQSVGDQQISWLGMLNRVVDSIAALKALSSSTHNRAFVTGYRAVGDGGGGAYYAVPSDTTSADNGGTIIVANDGMRWYMLNTRILAPEQFGTFGDDTTDDTAYLQLLAAALRAQGGGVVVISKPHKVFTNAATASGTTLFDLTGCSNVTFIYERGGLINAAYPNGSNVGTAWIFGLNGVTGFKAINPTLVAASNIPTVSGVVHFAVNTTQAAGTQTTNVDIENVNQTGGLAGLLVYSTGNASVRASGFRMTGSFNGTFYPANFQGNGDDFWGKYVTRNCGRSYFPYNVSHHEVWVDSNNGTAFDDIDITCYTNPNFRNETSDIKVHYKNYGSSSLGNAVAINFVQWDSTSRSGLIHDVHIDFDFNTSAYTGAIASINKYLPGSPGVPGGADNTARGYNLFNIKFTGTCLSSGNTQNLIQFFSQATWTGEVVYNLGFEDFMLSGTNTVDAVIDGRGLSSAGALYFRNTYLGIPTSLTNIPQGVTKYDNAVFNGARQDGALGGTWIVQSVAPGIARYTYNGSLSVATGTGTTITMPLSDKRGSNPQVFAQAKGTLCSWYVNPINASQFSIVHNAGAAVPFDIDVVMAI